MTLTILSALGGVLALIAYNYGLHRGAARERADMRSLPLEVDDEARKRPVVKASDYDNAMAVLLALAARRHGSQVSCFVSRAKEIDWRVSVAAAGSDFGESVAKTTKHPNFLSAVRAVVRVPALMTADELDSILAKCEAVAALNTGAPAPSERKANR